MVGGIRTWLENLGVGKYNDAFAENDVDHRALPHLDGDDLKELGVSLGHRKIILAAISEMNAGEVVKIQAEGVITPFDNDTVFPPLDRQEAERRQLTVMFCDLVGSTELSTRLDPEVLQVVIHAYQEAAAEVIGKFGGYIAKYMGDGLLVYFGYPQAHERDAERAVRTALGVVDAMAGLNAEAVLPDGVELAVRVGIDTGLVVVGEIVGEGDAQERTVVGETPNLAARLQELAHANGIVLGSVTCDLAGDSFIYEDLGARELKGIAGFVKVWGVRGVNKEIEEEADTKAANNRGPLPLVGRDEEVGLLHRAWQQTKDEGRGQAVLLNGEPGIGKTALVDVLRAKAHEEGLPRITFRSSPFHTGSALHPIIEYLKRYLDWQPEDAQEVRLGKLEDMLGRYGIPLPEVVPLLSLLLSLSLPEGRYPPLELNPQQIKEQTQDTLISWMLEEAERQPVVQVWEDLHWADPSTLELLGLLLEQVPTASLLIVLTFRPDFTPSWANRSHMTPITLGRLERPQIESLVTRLTGSKALPEDVVEHIVAKTDGVPLYVEELTKTILASDILRDEGNRYALIGALSSVTIPATLQESLMARLDRLPTVRNVAQLGAVLGREFSYAMLEELAEIDEPVLRIGLGQLVEAELLYQRGRPPNAKYIFKHALVQDAAYHSLLKRTRLRYHKNVAELIRSRFPEIEETQPEILAHHYTEADLNEQAVHFWREAGQRAILRAANLEAIDHLRNALELLRGLPEDAEHRRQELAVQISLAGTLSANKGYASPEAGEAYARAKELCHQGSEIPQLITALRGLWIYNFVRGDLQAARGIGDECFALTERVDDRAVFLEGSHMLGGVLFCTGEFCQADEHLNRAIALYDPAQHRNDFLYGSLVGILPICFAAHNFWHLGYPDQATDTMDQALALAHELSHPFALAIALDYAAMLHQFRREPQLAQEQAEAAITLCTDKGYAYYLAWGTIIQGWALVEQGGGADKIEHMREGLAGLRDTGAALRLPYYLVTLAEASGEAGRAKDGLTDLAEAEEAALIYGERWQDVERHRLRGELLLSQSPEAFPEAESAFLEAIEVARRQHAKSLELRAALSLSRLWQQRGKQAKAHELLAEIYGWFSEGHDTADLKDAKDLLIDLAEISQAVN